MSTYAVGDIQGCFDELQGLLQQIHFDDTRDTLWCVGDLVNRGPKSLETLRFLKSLGARVKVVLGNHDLHLLAVHYGVKDFYPDDTIQDVLGAPDREELIEWLRAQPLVHTGEGYVMVHAGFCPSWTVEAAVAFAGEVSDALKSKELAHFLKAMYGNDPDHWSPGLKGMDRLRVITNYLTRMRFCSADGHLLMGKKTSPIDCPEGYFPWFKAPHREIVTPIIFGHWSALQGKTDTENVFALDTGVVWGGALTAMRLEDQKRFTQLGRCSA